MSLTIHKTAKTKEEILLSYNNTNGEKAKHKETENVKKTIALAGNPNVGKSTIFNALTGLNQHTGNWTGKTVSNAKGKYTYNDKSFELVDLPGTYSLFAGSAEEEVARDYIESGNPDAVIIVCDATCLERNLNLALQIINISNRVILCVNLMDEARKKGINIDCGELSLQLGCEVVGVVARSEQGLDELKKTVDIVCSSPAQKFLRKIDFSGCISEEDRTVKYVATGEEIAKKCVSFNKESYDKRDRILDKIFTSRLTGIPIMLLLLGGIFWLTIIGANYPSELLSQFFNRLQIHISDFFEYINSPAWLSGIIVDGIYKTVAWVVAVMLPPMAIFFPLFTLLEDFGYLPRVAFNLDKFFRKSGADGKSALTMCMGFGCNACGVVGCRIISSPRERIISMLTNSFVPCNGRFPTIIAIITMFLIGGVSASLGNSLLCALVLLLVIVLGVILTLLASRFLSKTFLKGESTYFTLELPPYRRPQIGKVIVRSIFDRTLFVLGRAVTVAAPAGAVIWLFANINIGDASLISTVSEFLNPFASAIGLDGVILLAFILGFPANEIVFPIILMAYLSQGTLIEYESLSQLHELLIDNGWTITTAVCTMLFSLCHFPCSTTMISIYKETKSKKYTAIAFLLPLCVGIIICFSAKNILSLIL